MTIHAAAIALLATPVLAADYKVVDINERAAVFVDVASIREVSPSVRQFNEVFHQARRRVTQLNGSYDSNVLVIRADCVGGRMRTMRVALYDAQTNSTPHAIDPKLDWQAVPPAGLAREELDLVCGAASSGDASRLETLLQIHDFYVAWLKDRGVIYE